MGASVRGATRWIWAVEGAVWRGGGARGRSEPQREQVVMAVASHRGCSREPAACEYVAGAGMRAEKR